MGWQPVLLSLLFLSGVAAQPATGQVVAGAGHGSRPPARAHASMAFDPGRGRVVLVGGGTRTPDDRWITLGDVWSWDGFRWESSAVPGVTRSGHKLVFHRASNSLLVVGGNDNARFEPRVMALERDRWRQLDTLSSRSEAAVTYDPIRKRVVVFGGILDRRSLGTMHEFDGTRWHSIAAPGPAPRNSAVMSFHPATGKVVLFGGAGDNGVVFSDTWTWDGAAWTLADSVGPGPLIGAAVATDEERGEMILFGGVGPNGLSGATWAWNGTRWEERRTAGPTPRVVATMAYDPIRKVVVLFGGRTQGLVDSDETWEWDGRQWALRTAASPGEARADTIRIEVGSSAVNGSVYLPHRARVRVHLNSLDTPPTNEWTNELTIGDSAGRKVMRWVTLGRFDSAGTPGFDLRQTFDLISLAPLGYNLKTRAGASISLAIDGNRMRGTRKLPNNPVTEQVDQVIPRMGFIASASDLVPAAVGLSPGKVFIAPVWGPNMATAESHIFTIVGKESIVVEGKPVEAWKVEEYRESDRRLLSVWWVLDKSPYMVAGENYLPSGDVQKMTEIELP